MLVCRESTHSHHCCLSVSSTKGFLEQTRGFTKLVTSSISERMEIKVSVEGVQRIVCGVTKMTTCQDVVIALARTLGRTGHYTLREIFKGYERSMTPGEHLLEALEIYGQQAREVQLSLHYLGPSLVDWPNKPQVQLRRVEGGGHLRRSSAGAALHRQSLPLLDHLQPKPPSEEAKRPKRKSLMLIDGAWGWLENLGKERKQQLPQDKGKNRTQQLDRLAEKPVQTSQVSQGRDKNRPENKKWRQRDDKTEFNESLTNDKMQRNELHFSENQASALQHGDSEAQEKIKKLVIQQQADLIALNLKIETTDEEVLNLEMQQAGAISDEEEQLQFWLNELKAEEGYEKDLLMQFRDLKEKVTACKRQLEQYKIKLQGMNLANIRHTPFQSKPGAAVSVRMEVDRNSGGLESVREETTAIENPVGDGKKIAISRVESELPCIVVTANEIIEAQPSSPSELRERWHRWTDAQKMTSVCTGKDVHRSEIIYPRGTTV